MIRAFTIHDKFVLEGKGIALVGTPFPETVNCRLSEGTKVEVRSGGVVFVTAKLAEFELMRNCWSPHLPRGMAVLVKIKDFNLPEDAELWAEPSSIHQPAE
jgi:hypothetical protein